MGFFEGLDFFLVFIVLGVESVNHLETRREQANNQKQTRGGWS